MNCFFVKTPVLRHALKNVSRALQLCMILFAVAGASSTGAQTTTTVLNSSVNPSFVNQNTTLTATVSPSAATGTVTFRDGSTTLGTATLAAGVATLVRSFTTVGTRNLTAVYAGAGSYTSSTSAVRVQTVNAKVNTTTTLSSSANPAFVNQSITLTATVSPSTATGTVTFRNGSTTLGTGTLSGGVATFNTSFSTTGNRSLTAVYAGDVGRNSSTSSTVTQAVNAKVNTTTALSSSANPAFVNQSITLTATVSPSTATGTVTFRNGSTTLGTGTLSGGVATFNTSFSTTGNRSLTAVYAGDVGRNSSTSSTVTQAVNAKVNSTTALSSSANPAFVNQSITLTATVSPSTATGTVTFRNGSTTLGTGTLSGGVATFNTSFSTTGNRSLTAVYAGDVGRNSSTSSTVTQAVNAKVNTTTALSSSANPAFVNQSITLTATVSPSTATGTVTFRNGSTTLGTGTLSGGVATFNTSFSTTGNHSLTAVYAGDVGRNSSTSSTVTQAVNSALSVTTISAYPNPATLADSVRISAGVEGNNPTGTVVFKDGTTTLGSAVLVSAGATYSYTTINITFATAGLHNLRAEYGGDANNPSSVSGTIVETVTKQATTTSLTSSLNPLRIGQNTMLTATVSGSTPTGTITFRDGASVLATVGVDATGRGTYSAAFTAAGTHSLTASYSGDATYEPSLSAALSQTVNLASPVTPEFILTASPSSVVANAPVNLSFRVEGFNPVGAIDVYVNNQSYGRFPQSGATITLSAVGQHVIRANYVGDVNNNSVNSNPVWVQVSAATAATPGPMTWLYGYDPQGNPWIEIDPKGKETNRNFDSLNRPAYEARPPSGGSAGPTVTLFDYDLQDSLAKVTDPRGLATTYTRDGLKNLGTLTSPDTGAANATFDAAGNMITRIDSRGKQTTYSYDALNRLTRAAYASGTPTVFEYDGGTNPGPNSAGRLTRITDESGSTSYTYDAMGRVLTKTQIVGTKTLTTAYAWGSTGSATGSLTSITYPSGSRVNYAYDLTGRVSSVSINPANANGVGTNTAVTTSVLTAIRYNAEGSIAGWTWSDASTVSRTFDGFGRLGSYPLGNPAGSGTAAGLLRTLTYDDAGQITGYTHTRSGTAQSQFDQGFVYDDLGQLTSNTQAATSYGYSYDANGNRTLRVIAGTGYSQTIATNSNQLMQAQSAAGPSTFSYDNAGNMLTDGVVTYTYSDRGRMSIATIGANAVNYAYNGLEQRVSKTGPTALVPTGATYYAYDEAGKLMGEYDTNLAPMYETVYLGNTPIVVLKQTGAAANSTLQVNFYNVWADHIDTPRVITRASDQAIVWRWDTAEAFGATAPDQNPNGLGVFAFNQRFPGQVLDLETGAYYNWNRIYSPSVGRYTQSDPIGLAGGINTYAYVKNTPSMLVDPTGLMPHGGKMPNKHTLKQCPDPCVVLEASIAESLKLLKTAWVKLYYDPQDLWDRARYYRIPGLERLGSYNGHVMNFFQLKSQLNNQITLAKEFGCPVDPEAEHWAKYAVPPLSPMTPDPYWTFPKP